MTLLCPLRLMCFFFLIYSNKYPLIQGLVFLLTTGTFSQNMLTLFYVVQCCLFFCFCYHLAAKQLPNKHFWPTSIWLLRRIPFGANEKYDDIFSAFFLPISLSVPFFSSQLKLSQNLTISVCVCVSVRVRKTLGRNQSCQDYRISFFLVFF